MPDSATKPNRAVLLSALLACFLTSIVVQTASTNPVFFDEVAEKSGVNFHHISGAIGKRFTLEITGAGVGVLDFDNDGLLDIWIIQGGPLKDRSGDLPSDRLFRNVSTNGELAFVDVTDESGVSATEYGMGIATGDVDNDGDTDVFLANFGRNQLFINQDGVFTEQLDSEVSVPKEWSLSASFADLNQDGLLDLYVANYMEFPPINKYKVCRRLSTRKGYCAPSNFEPTADRLYLNVGKGQFQDVSSASGIDSLKERGMGVVVNDFNADQLPDIYVANDMAMNFLWYNNGDLTFTENALRSGVAVNGHGMREASMGIAIGDWDKDFDADLFLTHDLKESNTLYVNEQPGWFSDGSVLSGVASSSFSKTGFGTFFFDVENDGDLDLFIANGSVSMIDSQRSKRIEPPLRQKNQLLLNEGGKFTEMTEAGFQDLEEVSRGAAFADLDNDGDFDIVVSNNEGPTRIHSNQAEETQNHWLGLDVRHEHGPAVGATVRVGENAPTRLTVRSDGSYASASDMRVLAGLGGLAEPQVVVVRWSDGTVQQFNDLAVDQYHVLRKSTTSPR